MARSGPLGSVLLPAPRSWSPVFTALIVAAAVSPHVPVYKPEGCDHIRPSQRASHGLTRALKHTYPPPPTSHVRDLWGCVKTRPKAHRLHLRAHRLWDWRHREPNKSWIVYHREPSYWRAWAERVVQCESGGNPNATNGSHWGRFQWLMSTYYAAGGHGRPERLSYPQEALLAIGWAEEAGTSQWQCR